jgi:diacylglycerol kinase (ATP)
VQAIVHPRAAGHPLWTQLRQSRPDLRYEISRFPGHAQQLAAAAESATVLAVGGDGTVHQVVNGLLQRPHAGRLGVIPVGSGNDIARSLGIARRLAPLLEMLQHETSDEVDVLRLEFPSQRVLYALGFVGVGFSSHAVACANRCRGKLPASLLYLAGLLGGLCTWRNVALRVSPTYSAEIMNFNIANLRHYGGGMIASPHADPRDGRFECVAMALSRLRAICNLHHTYSGHFHKVRGVTQWSAQDVDVDAPAPLPVQADGELVGTTPFRCVLVPRALRVARIPSLINQS